MSSTVSAHGNTNSVGIEDPVLRASFADSVIPSVASSISGSSSVGRREVAGHINDVVVGIEDFSEVVSLVA